MANYLDRAWKVVTIFCTIAGVSFGLGWAASDYLWKIEHAKVVQEHQATIDRLYDDLEDAYGQHGGK